MSMRPFQGRCHTCGHDHDSEAVTLRDVMDIGKVVHEQQQAELRADLERVRGALRRVVDAYDRQQSSVFDSLRMRAATNELSREVAAARAELGGKA